MIMSWIKSCFNVLLCLMFSAVPMLGLLLLLAWAGSTFGFESDSFPAKVLLFFGAAIFFLSIVLSYRLYAGMHADEERLESFQDQMDKHAGRER